MRSQQPIQRILLIASVLCSAGTASADLGVYINGGNPTCGNSTGYAIAYGTGGVPPYTYEWNTLATTDTITGLAPGFYSVTVTDANSDQATSGITLSNEPNPVYSDIWPGGGLHGCHGLCNNGVWYYEEYMPLNLVPPFSFSPEPIYGVNQMDPDQGAWVGLCDGTQTYATVTDGLGCLAQLMISIFSEGSDPTPMSVVSTQPSCEGMSGGVMTVNVGYEEGAYTPIWNSTLLDENMQVVPGVYIGAIPLPGQNVTSITNRPPGDYYIERRFQNFTGDCTDLLPVTIASLGPDCGMVNGNAFMDDNENCLQNGGEVLVPYGIIEVLPGPYYTTLAGSYQICLPTGDYTLTQQSAAVEEHCAGGPIPFTIIAGANVSRPLPDTSIVALDLQVDVASGPARPGFQFQCGAMVRNLTPTASGAITLTMVFDPLLTYLSAQPAPTNVTGNTITWNGPQLLAWQQGAYTVQFSVPADPGLIGTELVTTASVSSINTDGYPANNAAVNHRTITGSYDPNDKVARTSTGLSDVLYFIDQDEWIDYTIRFQNTGTDTAFNILVTDTIGEELDPSTLQVGAASHAFSWELRDQGVLKFHFQNILLLDSNYSEPLSHGFVSLRIRPREPVLPGTVIENVANIFFDYNPPVITEPSVLVAEFSTQVQGSTGPQRQLELVPNPASDRISVILGTGQLRALEILALDGRTMMRTGVTGHRVEVAVNTLVPGAYILRAETSDGGVHQQRFIKL